MHRESPRLSTALVALSLLFASPAAAQSSTAGVYSGRARQTTVAIPRLDGDAVIDGVLDDAVWSRAARLTGFSQYRPVDGRPAEDSTEVLVFYSASAIHFGVRAWESHGNVVRATLADRDNIAADDRVQILLDTYDDNRRALLFAVNPLGVQQDGVQSEGFDPSQSAGGRFDGIVDISPDFNFESRGHVTPWGYEVEVRIPFKSLRYQSADPQRWGLQISRTTQHSGYEDTWAPAIRANASFLVQSGRLTGLTGLRRGTVVDLDPEFTSSVAGAPDSGSWNYDNPRARLGGNLRWGVTPNYTLNATIRPDFSQVEADVSQVTVNERFALFFPEKRPFFLEGLEQYDTPNRLIYTRQIHAPLGGVKLTGKSGGTAIAYLGAQDDRRYSLAGADAPIFNLLRVRRDLGASSTVGIVHTDRIEGSHYNRVSGADARVVWRKIWFTQAQLAGAWTRDRLGARQGTLWDVTIADRTGRAYGNHFEIEGISPRFETRSGFVPRTGVVFGRFANRFSVYGRPGALLEQLSTFIIASPVWLYDEFPGSSTFEGGFSEMFNAALRGGWTLRAQIGNSHQRFDPTSYGGYRVDRGADTIALAQPHGLYGLWGGSVGASTPNRALTLSVDLSTGAAVIFAEAAEGRANAATLAASWHPNASLRVETSLVHQRITRARDGTRFSTATIPRLKTEYQLSRAIFLRYVGQYVAQDRTALVDARTGFPLIASSFGTARFGPSGALIVNDFRNDFLFSYKPTPGTVFFFGYGASLTEPEAFSFRAQELRRVSDGFFLKASYRYRL
ncbi:MAG TPA: DUF5916 domain-containing protein [Gemmatimonadaceae bacterium]|nr:DUF5916 domain-containing protein [Gemmatimonadaceae bacterium]